MVNHVTNAPIETFRYLIMYLGVLFWPVLVNQSIEWSGTNAPVRECDAADCYPMVAKGQNR